MSRRKRINLKVCYEVAFSPDGQLLAVIGRDVVLWDFPRGEKRFRVHPLSHPSHVAFSRSGDRLAVKILFDRNFFLNLPYGINVDFPAAPSYGNSSVEFRHRLLISSVGLNSLLHSNKDCLMIL